PEHAGRAIASEVAGAFWSTVALVVVLYWINGGGAGASSGVASRVIAASLGPSSVADASKIAPPSSEQCCAAHV
ncbi:MAG TPA: hypothetical protein VIV58_17815, partial [Kofleriaceae bacterium]